MLGVKIDFITIFILNKKVDAILKDVSVAEIIFNVKILFKGYHLSVFQKLRHSATCNQAKSCIKHGPISLNENLP